MNENELDLEYRYAPVELEGRVLSGTVMPYGEIAKGAPRPEKFIPGSLRFSDVILNVQHDRNRPIARTDGGLELTDSQKALELRATLPETREGDDTIELVKKRVLRGLSVEFRAISEHYEAGVRVITDAILSGIAIVDRPAYQGAVVEARAIAGLRVNFSVPKGSRLRCECCPDADEVNFLDDAFAESFDDGDTLAVAGNYRGALASRRRGSLVTRETDEALEVQTSIANTQAGRDLIEQSRDVPIYGRPIVDFGKSEYSVSDGTANIRKAHVRGFILGPTDANKGWSPVNIVRDQENRRVHVWL